MIPASAITDTSGGKCFVGKNAITKKQQIAKIQGRTNDIK